MRNLNFLAAAFNLVCTLLQATVARSVRRRLASRNQYNPSRSASRARGRRARLPLTMPSSTLGVCSPPPHRPTGRAGKLSRLPGCGSEPVVSYIPPLVNICPCSCIASFLFHDSCDNRMPASSLACATCCM